MLARGVEVDGSIPCRFCGININAAAVRAGEIVHAGTTVAHETCVHPPHVPAPASDRWQALQFNRYAEIVAIV